MTPALLAGVGVGAGLWLVATGLVPARAPLPWTLARLGQPPPDDGARAGAGPAVRLGVWLRRASPVGMLVEGLRTELRVLRGDRDRAATAVGAAGVSGMAVGGVVAAAGVPVLAGPVPVVVPLVAAVAGAAVGAVAAVALAVWRVRWAAARARAAAGDALASFCDVLAVALAAGHDVADAVLDAASRGSGPMFAELRDVLDEEDHPGECPWDALGRLGRDLRIDDLTALATDLAPATGPGAAASRVAGRAARLQERRVAGLEREAAGTGGGTAVVAALLFATSVLVIAYPALDLLLREAGG